MQVTGVLKRPLRPKNVVPFNNGLLCIKSGKLDKATPTHSMDWVLPHGYDEAAECNNIKAWLFETVNEDRDTFNLLRAWIAALIRGIGLHKMLILIGPGGTGKSTFERLIVATIGESNTAASTLSNLENNRFEMAKHYGKSLCLINEAGNYHGELNQLKAMTGRDPLSLERKHQQQSGSFKYGGLVLLATNDDISASDSGLERRRATIRFAKRVSAKQRKDWLDSGGEESVLHSEIPGLIRWALDLPVDEIHKSFEHLPEQVIEENMLGMRAGSSVADWAFSECYFDPKVENQMGKFKRGEESSEHLYPAYRIWCEQNGRHYLAGNQFKKELFEIALKLDYELVVCFQICLQCLRRIRKRRHPKALKALSTTKSLQNMRND